MNVHRSGRSWPNPDEEAASMGGFAFAALRQSAINPLQTVTPGKPQWPEGGEGVRRTGEVDRLFSLAWR